MPMVSWALAVVRHMAGVHATCDLCTAAVRWRMCRQAVSIGPCPRTNGTPPRSKPGASRARPHPHLYDEKGDGIASWCLSLFCWLTFVVSRLYIRFIKRIMNRSLEGIPYVEVEGSFKQPTCSGPDGVRMVRVRMIHPRRLCHLALGVAVRLADGQEHHHVAL
jgi:hypothetical protein